MNYKKGDIWIAKIENSYRAVLIATIESNIIKVIPITNKKKNDGDLKLFKQDDTKHYITKNSINLMPTSLYKKIGKIAI